MPQSTKDRAESLELLAPRLSVNQKCQDRDFQSWLRFRLAVQPGEKILDLACGNGAQSKFFDQRIGASGFLKCVDIHEPSIASVRSAIGEKSGREFVVSDMMQFSNYLNQADAYTLAHCSFALPYASEPATVIKNLADSLQLPLGRLAISLPCRPHGMVEFAKSIHSIPTTVCPAIDLAESLCVPFMRDLFGELDVSYFNSNLIFDNSEDFMSLYRSTTYYSPSHDSHIANLIESRIEEFGSISFAKSAILIIGRDPTRRVAS